MWVAARSIAMSAESSGQGKQLFGAVEEGMPVYDLHNEPVGTVSQVGPEHERGGDIRISDGIPGVEYAARADQLGAVDPEEGIILNVPRNDLDQG
jgi:hypothetical protein